MTKNKSRHKITEINAHKEDTEVMSPNIAASACPIGKNKKARATPEAKTTAVSASIGNFVLISKSQIKIIPNKTKGKAPKETSNP